MKKTFQKTGFTVVIFTMLVSTLFAQQPPVQEAPDDFCINVVAGQDGHVLGDRLNLILELSNNSSKNVVLAPSNEPAPIDTQTPPDAPAEGDPQMPAIIGTARLILLDTPPLPEPDKQADAELPEGPQTQIQIPLQLFGDPVVPGHSTVIISLAGIPLAKGPAPEEPDGKPVNQEDLPEKNDEFMGIRPGLYLLDCEVNAIEGIEKAYAQKIVRILPPPHDNGRRPNPRHKPQQ